MARIVADYGNDHHASREAAWMAEVDGRRVGCIFCVAAEGTDQSQPRTAKLRILLVHPDGRGRGLGGRLVDTCIEFAREAGYRRMQLWTNEPLRAARHLYLDRGFTLVESRHHHSFGVDLIGQVYDLDLTASTTAPRGCVPRHSRVI